MKPFFAKLFSRFRQPKWRHGKLSTAVTLCFVAACVVLNVVVSTLEDEYGWRWDLSFNGYATTGEETARMMAQVDTTVELYLLYQNGDEDVQLLQVLRRYATLSDHVKVILTDINQNPGILTRFVGDEETTVAADSVIVHCPATGRYKVLDYNDFLTIGYDIDSGSFAPEYLAYEKNLTEAIVYVSREQLPVAGFLAGHSEITMENLSVFTEFLQSNHFSCREVNLLGGDSLEGVDVLFIVGPQKDLSQMETDAIAAYASEGGNLFIVRDFTDPIAQMPNYMALLRSYGVVPLEGVVVAGLEDQGSYYGDQPLYLLPYMCEMDLTLPLIINHYDILLMPAASAFETPGEPGDTSLSVGTVLKSGPNAYIRSLTDGNQTLDMQPGDRQGEISVALYAHRMHYNGNVSRMFALGNSAMLTDEFIYQSTYNQEFLTILLGDMAPSGVITLENMNKAAFHPALNAGSQGFGTAVIILIPLLSLLAALVVLLPRYNR